jgi:N-methylhydantoinase B/oxoprolinase/acetone carboxylase alpha subunit
MPKQVYRIDQDGYFIEPVLINEDEKIPADCVEVFPTSGMYKQKWNGTAWVEGLSQAEIDALKNVAEPVSELDKLKKNQELMQAALDGLLLGGGL